MQIEEVGDDMAWYKNDRFQIRDKVRTEASLWPRKLSNGLRTGLGNGLSVAIFRDGLEQREVLACCELGTANFSSYARAYASLPKVWDD